MSETTVDVLTPLDVEIEFRIPRASQKKGRASGTFAPFFRVGRRVYYRRAVLEGWIAKQEQHQAGVSDGSKSPQLSDEQLDRIVALLRSGKGGDGNEG